jgi:hypothetical protein
MALLCRLGDGNLDLTAGIGGWDEVKRPRTHAGDQVAHGRCDPRRRAAVPQRRASNSIEPQVTLLVGLAGRGPNGSEASRRT